jgi:hypothetical protein
MATASDGLPLKSRPRLAWFRKGRFRDEASSLSIERRNQIASEYGTLRRRKPPEFQRAEVGDGTSVERARRDGSIAAPFERD